VCLHAPAPNLATEQVQHHGQVQPALVGRDICDVTRPYLIGGTGSEVALQQVRCNRQVVLAVGGDHKLPFAPGLDTVLLHRASHALLAHADTACHQFLPHLGPTVFLLDLGVNGPDVGQQGFVADALVGARLGGLARAFASHVLKVAAGAHAQHLAGQ